MGSESKANVIDRDSLDRLRGRLPQMIQELAALTDIESPSEALGALAKCAGYLELLGTSVLGFEPKRIEVDGHIHLLWQFGEEPRILFVGHYDTVHPLGTIERFPFSVDDGIARGPGVCDMKGGVVVAMHAIAELIAVFGSSALDGLALFINADEEVGSPTSRSTLLELSKTLEYAMGFENANGMHQLKTSRRGRSGYQLVAHGKAVHAGERPDLGVNALGEMCKHFDEVASLSDFDAGTSVTPTVARAGSTINTVPDRAEMTIDVRCWDRNEQLRVDEQIRLIQAFNVGARIEITGGINHPPLTNASSKELFEVATVVAPQVGIDDLSEIAVGGSADTCTLAGMRVKAIDGLGAFGGDDHTESEWIRVDSMPDHAALAAAMAAHLLQCR